MSPQKHNRNVPILEMLPIGGTQIGENELERQGTESGGSDGTGEGGQLAAGRSGGVAGAELSAGEAGVGAVSGRRGQGLAARQLRAKVEPCVPAEFRRRVLERVEQRYADFGPTLASEHLDSEAGLKIPAESLRRWMREAG